MTDSESQKVSKRVYKLYCLYYGHINKDAFQINNTSGWPVVNFYFKDLPNPVSENINILLAPGKDFAEYLKYRKLLTIGNKKLNKINKENSLCGQKISEIYNKLCVAKH